MRCQRCGKETNSFIMSMFNEDLICMDCKKAEREHPAYAEAREVELTHVKAGDYNFKGVGFPS